MVVFENLKPVKKAYRRFKIKTVEVPTIMPPCRKCSTGGLSAQSGDPGFAVLPDLILMDGGIGQVTSAEKVLKAMGVQIPVLGMAKDDSHRTRALVNGRGTSSTCRRSCTVSILRKDSGGSSQVCDKYHRNLRGKNSIGSALDNIQGIGPAKRNALLAHFDSIEEIKLQKKNLPRCAASHCKTQKR